MLKPASACRKFEARTIELLAHDYVKALGEYAVP